MLSNYFNEELASTKSLAAIAEDNSQIQTQLNFNNLTQKTDQQVQTVEEPLSDIKTEIIKLKGPEMEEWLNTVLQKKIDDNDIPSKIRKGLPNQPATQVFRIDLMSLQ